MRTQETLKSMPRHQSQLDESWGSRHALEKQILDVPQRQRKLTPSAQVYYNNGFDNLDLNLPIAKTKSYTKTDIRLTYVSGDDRITLQAYVENLEDHAVLNRTAIGANRSINASYALPRTYGIKAGYKF